MPLWLCQPPSWKHSLGSWLIGAWRIFSFRQGTSFWTCFFCIQACTLCWNFHMCVFSLYSMWSWLYFYLSAFPYVRASSTSNTTIGHSWDFIVGLLVGGPGNLAIIKSSLRFVCPLKAVRGGSGKHLAKYWSLLSIALQCFAWMDGIDGSLGSYLIANTCILLDFFFFIIRTH